MSKRSLGAVALIFSLVIAACGGSNPTPTVSPTVSPTPSRAAASPTLQPSPTPEPSQDVAPLFLARVGELSRGVMTFEAEVIAGNIQFTMSGTSRVNGPDSESSMTTTIAGVATTVETVQVAGSRYSRTGAGPWLPATLKDAASLGDELLRAGEAPFTDVGVQTRDGREVHRLEPTSNTSFDVAALLSSASGVAGMQASLVFFADDDGLPIAAEIEATWTQTVGESTVNAEMRLVMEFSQIGVRQTIRTPANVWTTFTSARWSYSIGYPGDYDYSKNKKFDVFVGPVRGFISIARHANNGLTANQIARMATTVFKREVGAKSISNDPISLGGRSGRLLTVTGSHKDLNGKYLAFQAIVVKGKNVYFVEWYLPQGDQPAKLAEFMQLVSTFAFTS